MLFPRQHFQLPSWGLLFWSFSLLAQSSTLPPLGSWEAWLLRLQKPTLKKVLPAERPDKKNLSEPLPLWVDCHLSWLTDNPRYGRNLKLPSGVVLRSNPKTCRGQIEEWAL